MPAEAELGGEDDLVPAALEGLPEVALGAAEAAVDVGGVEEGDARVEGGVDDGAGRLGVEVRPPKLLQPSPTAET